MPNTPFDRIWSQHVVREYGDDRALIHIDRHFAQEGTSGRAFDGLRERGLKVRRPELTVGTIDHGLSTLPGRKIDSYAASTVRNLAMRRNCAEFGVRLFDIDDANHGIVHVVGPHIGFALPGCTYVCGDSHTASCGGVGAWAWGIGTTEVMQVLATQTLIMRRPRTLRANFIGKLPRGVYAKDMILALIGKYGIEAGVGHVVEYAGPAIRALPIEGRLTICNMSIEFGARGGLIAADDTTFGYLHGREMAPKGVLWDRAVADWRALFDTPEAHYDTDLEIDCVTLSSAGHLGHDAAGRDRGRRNDPRPVNRRRSGATRDDGARDRLYRPDAGREDRRHADRRRVHRLLHQWPPVRSGSCRGSRPRTQGRSRRQGTGRSGCGSCQSRRRSGRPAQGVSRGRFRMARSSLLYVRRRRWRHRAAGETVHFYLEPELRGQARPWQPHPSRQPGDGGRRGGHRMHYRRARAVELKGPDNGKIH